MMTVWQSEIQMGIEFLLLGAKSFMLAPAGKTSFIFQRG
jgi:hypothetical protein